MKESIWLILNLSSWFLKQLTELTWTADCGRLFQRFRVTKPVAFPGLGVRTTYLRLQRNKLSTSSGNWQPD